MKNFKPDFTVCIGCNGTGNVFSFPWIIPCAICKGTGKSKDYENIWPTHNPWRLLK